MQTVLDSVIRFLNTGIAGGSITPLRLRIVAVLLSALAWATRRAQWFVASLLARRGVDVDLREALGAILRYALLAMGALLILQGAGIERASSTSRSWRRTTPPWSRTSRGPAAPR